MDKDVRQIGPGKCPRCGMKLVASLPEHRNFRLVVAPRPNPVQAGAPAKLEFSLRDPASGKLVQRYEKVHDRLFHLFIISEDLSYFAHEHPEQQRNGKFLLSVTLPMAASYRLLADCYPAGATPQFLPATLFTANPKLEGTPKLTPDRAPKKSANLTVTLTTEPAQPIAGQETLLFFTVDPADRIEPYLQAWAHLLAASDDLIDLIHDHPLYVDGVPPADLKRPFPSRIQFNVIFPREAMYRVWVQCQRAGILNTCAFTIPVQALR
jgi:hypothetical protein